MQGDEDTAGSIFVVSRTPRSRDDSAGTRHRKIRLLEEKIDEIIDLIFLLCNIMVETPLFGGHR